MIRISNWQAVLCCVEPFATLLDCAVRPVHLGIRRPQLVTSSDSSHLSITSPLLDHHTRRRGPGYYRLPAAQLNLLALAALCSK